MSGMLSESWYGARRRDQAETDRAGARRHAATGHKCRHRIQISPRSRISSGPDDQDELPRSFWTRGTINANMSGCQVGTHIGLPHAGSRGCAVPSPTTVARPGTPPAPFSWSGRLRRRHRSSRAAVPPGGSEERRGYCQAPFVRRGRCLTSWPARWPQHRRRGGTTETRSFERFLRSTTRRRGRSAARGCRRRGRRRDGLRC